MIKKLCLLSLCLFWSVSNAYAEDGSHKTYEDCFKLPREILKSPPADADWHTRLCVIDYVEWSSKDKKAAFDGYLSLAEEGYGLAQSFVAEYYQKGTGTTKDISKALFGMKKRQNRGLPEAQNNYAFIYFYGKDGIEKDRSKAIPWLLKAAAQNHANSQTLLAEAYEVGDGLPQDYKKAYELYLKASEQNHSYAQYRLGFFYYAGLGAAKDTAKAQQWFQKSALQGMGGAQYFMGMCYLEACAGTQDNTQAYQWFYVASLSSMQTPAQERMQEMEKVLTLPQVEQAKAQGDKIIEAMKQ